MAKKQINKACLPSFLSGGIFHSKKKTLSEGKNAKILDLHHVGTDLPFCQHMGAQLGQEISKPLWTVDRCNPSLLCSCPPPILSLSQACSDQTLTCGKAAWLPGNMLALYVAAKRRYVECQHFHFYIQTDTQSSWCY